MKYFDLHCDTLVKMEENGLDFSSEKLHVNKERTKIFEEYRQVFAFFTDDALPPSDAGDRFSRTIKRLEDTENVIPYFAVEGGGVLENELDNISRIELFAPCFFSLCWNGENAFACGNLKDPEKGLTKKGKELVKTLEKKHIFLDVSHLSDAGFDDLAEIATRPIVATHSNARSVCPHPRNCTDRQLREIFSKDGLCGLNFYPPFVGEKPEDFLRHIEHMLSLGGETCIAVGGDWDGMTPFEGVCGIDSVPFIYETTERAFGKTTADNIFYQNAFSFFQRNNLL